MSSAAPSLWKSFGQGDEAGVFLVDGSRVYSIDPRFRDDLDAGVPAAQAALAPALHNSIPNDLSLPEPPAPQSISLNVSSSCNLSCAYCYAGRGGFDGKQPGLMKWPVARAAVDKLLDGANPSAPITVGFLGGEPFANRRLIHKVTRYAAARGRDMALDIRFSVTTNGSLLE